MAKSHQKKVHSFTGLLRWEGRSGCALAHFPDSRREGQQQEPVGPACLLLKPPRHTRAFGEDGAGAGRRPEPPSLRHGRVRETISRTRGGGGGLWRSLECPSAAGPPPRQRPVRSRPWCPRLAPRSGLHIVQWRPGPGSRQGPGGRAGGQGRGLPHRSGQLPQEAPQLGPSPSLGAAWRGAPWVQSLLEPPAPPSPDTDASVRWGVGCEITVRTPESMHMFLLFRKKRSPFPVFHLFVVFFFEFFFFFKL